MSRSPIEIMIDRACGIPDGWEPPARPLIRCSVEGCSVEKRCVSHDSDPPGTAVVLYPCEAHAAEREGVEVAYLDADGREIGVLW